MLSKKVNNKKFLAFIISVVAVFAIVVTGFGIAGANIFNSSDDNAPILSDGYYRIATTKEDIVFDDYGGSFDRGANVWLYSSNKSEAQVWKVINRDQGLVQIVNCNNGLTMDVAGGKANNGTNVQLFYQNMSKA